MYDEVTDFIVYCIEEYKAANGLDGRTVIDIFEKHDVIGYIRQYYEALHTTGRQYIVNDLHEYIQSRQNSLQ